MPARPLTAEELARMYGVGTPSDDEFARANKMFVGRDPRVAAGYKMDPRTGVADSLIKSGSNMGPLGGGGAMEGIARALSGGLGGYAAKQQQDKWLNADNVAAYNRNQAITPDVIAAANRTLGPNGEFVSPSPVQQVASSMGGATPPAAPDPTPAPAVGQIAAAPTTVSPSPRILRPGQTARVGGRPSAPSGWSRLGATPKGWEGVGTNSASFQSYRSPAYEPIESEMEAKYGLPSGALKGLRMAERSNADQVSSTGARSVYQFVPGTRRRFKAKFGVDAWGSPQGAVEAAALHLKGSLDRGKDIEGALRDYRGVGEDADPGWYKRARGGIAAGGSVAAPSAAPSPAGVPMGDINTTQHEPVPDLPAAPTRPDRPEFGDRVRSTRLAIVQNLLQNSDPRMGNVMRAGLIDDFLQEGLTEDQASKVQREKDIRAQDQDDYQAGLNLYNTEAGALYKQPLEERTAAKSGNRAADAATTAYGRQAALQEDAQKAAVEAARAAAETRASERQPPVFAQKDYNTHTNTISDGTAALTILAGRPQSVGARFALGSDLSQRFDPDGVPVRSAIVKLAGLLLHGISGSAVTPTEWDRNKDWLPTVHDTPEAIKAKMENIMNSSRSAQANLRNQYPAAEMFAATSSPYTGAMSNNPAPAAAPTVDYSQFKVH